VSGWNRDLQIIRFMVKREFTYFVGASQVHRNALDGVVEFAQGAVIGLLRPYVWLCGRGRCGASGFGIGRRDRIPTSKIRDCFCSPDF